MKQNFSVRDLPPAERPRERLENLGPGSLSLPELLALILGRGDKNHPVGSLAGQILSKFPTLTELAEASPAHLKTIEGLGQAKASQLAACFELARRLTTSAVESLTDSDPTSIAALVRSKINHNKKEHYFVVSLDARNRVLGIDQVSVGTLTANLVHPRETFEAAIRRHAAHIIISHNHPSGEPEPSDEDLAITQRITAAGKVVGIAVLDHIIVTGKQYLSFQERNLM